MDKTYVYCQVLLEGVKFTYSYISDFDIKVGDIVVVPFGYQNTERAALVVAVNEHTAETAPYPPEKTKHISRLFDQPENAALQQEKARLEEKAPAYKTAASTPGRLKVYKIDFDNLWHLCYNNNTKRGKAPLVRGN